MKRMISLFIVVLLIVPMFALTGCSTNNAVVESVLEIDSAFKGHREITVRFPLDVNVDKLKESLEKVNPFVDSKKSSFGYRGVDEKGHVFVMDIVFDSHDEYIAQCEELVSREVTSYMAQPDTIFTKGTRMLEDFDVSQLVGWMVDVAQKNENTESVDYEYDINTVSINGKVFNTDSTVDISQRDGKPINSILIETTNLKDGTYDRTITFSIPNNTYTALIGSIEEYFKTNTSPAAQYCDFSSRGTSWEYKVIYKGITLEEMSEYTSMLLDVDQYDVFYGDKNNASTPLSEGLVFEETINTMSFMGFDGKSIEVDYKYALPTKTTHGDGLVYSDGVWKTQGTWEDGIYSVSAHEDTMNVRIPDGIEYLIDGIRFSLDVIGSDEFVRITEFLYSKTQGLDGAKYAFDFFESKGANVEESEEEDNFVCKVICSGSAEKITKELVDYFGSGNFMTYEVVDSFMSLSDKTTFTDYINFSHMLNYANTSQPMTYTVKSSCSENISELSFDDGENVQKTSEKNLTVDVKGGNGTVVYSGSIPNATNVAVYIVVGLLLIAITLVLISHMIAKQRRKTKADKSTYVPSQTTTFSIAQLNKLSDKTSKKLREEIDRDIDAKIEADRIEQRAKELKAEEIERLNKMVHAQQDTQAEEATCDESSEKIDDECSDE